MSAPVSPVTAAVSREASLRRLELTVTRRLEGLLHGQHLGLLPGVGSEPAESRPYRPGEDDVRRMDWAVTARTSQPHVRDLVADHELVTTVIVDASPSMDFGTALMEKRDLALAAVAAVGFLTQRSGNKLAAYVGAPETALRWPARTGRGPLMALLKRLGELPRGEASGAPPNLADVLLEGGRHASRRGLAVVVSDFLDDDVDGWERQLRRLAVRHEVLAMEIVDPRELELPDVGMLALVDPETGRRRDVWTGSRGLRERFAAAAREQRRTISQAVRRSGASHVQLRTDRDWVDDLARFAMARRRVRAAARPRAAAGAVR